MNTLLLLLSMSPGISSTAWAQLLERIPDEMPLSVALNVTNPTGLNDPNHHATPLKRPISVSIDGDLPIPIDQIKPDSVLYFANGEPSLKQPGWTSWCSAWPRTDLAGSVTGGVGGFDKKVETHERSDIKMDVTTIPGEVHTRVIRPAVYNAYCWEVVPARIERTQDPDKVFTNYSIKKSVATAVVIGLHLREDAGWGIDCHYMDPGITVGEFRDIFGRDRITLSWVKASPPKLAFESTNPGKVKADSKALQSAPAPSPQSGPVAQAPAAPEAGGGSVVQFAPDATRAPASQGLGAPLGRPLFKR
jgi:hypothetical protein